MNVLLDYHHSAVELELLVLFLLLVFKMLHHSFLLLHSFVPVQEPDSAVPELDEILLSLSHRLLFPVLAPEEIG